VIAKNYENFSTVG